MDYNHTWECMGYWCPPRTSNPMLPDKNGQGGFDSHTLPPVSKQGNKVSQSISRSRGASDCSHIANSGRKNANKSLAPLTDQ